MNTTPSRCCGGIESASHPIKLCCLRLIPAKDVASAARENWKIANINRTYLGIMRDPKNRHHTARAGFASCFFSRVNRLAKITHRNPAINGDWHHKKRLGSNCNCLRIETNTANSSLHLPTGEWSWYLTLRFLSSDWASTNVHHLRRIGLINFVKLFLTKFINLELTSSSSILNKKQGCIGKN